MFIKSYFYYGLSWVHIEVKIHIQDIYTASPLLRLRDLAAEGHISHCAAWRYHALAVYGSHYHNKLPGAENAT
jgi:hypothetical protein